MCAFGLAWRECSCVPMYEWMRRVEGEKRGRRRRRGEKREKKENEDTRKKKH